MSVLHCKGLLPPFDAKFLEFLPSLGDDKVTCWSAKRVSATAAEMGEISLGIRDPVENLGRKHLVGQLRDLWADLVEQGWGEEH